MSVDFFSIEIMSSNYLNTDLIIKNRINILIKKFNK